jgi:hypothetical protein
MFSATKDAHQVRIALGQTSIQLASATYGYGLGEVGDAAAVAVETMLGGDRLSNRPSSGPVEPSKV